jgi:threonylcarbamoyladenosine tRNA methylthiotransferase MtaB
VRIVTQTLGCRLNRAETDAIEAMLRGAGHELTDDLAAADVFVLNSCTITHQADADARQIIRRVRRDFPDVRVAVTGCWAHAAANEVAALGADMVLGNGDKAELAERLGASSGPRSAALVSVSSLVRSRTFVPLRAALPRSRARALLKVQDGCNYRCAFCIVPQVRGVSRSLPVAEVVAQLHALQRAGAPEIVLTGIHLGAYGRDLRPRVALADLVAALVPHLARARLRLSSLDPHEVTDDLIALMAEHEGAICRHLHLPVQSGDGGVLRRMRRGHTVAEFVDLVARATNRVRGIALGTDVIVGFPGEDEAAFRRTHELFAGLPLAYHHVFSYSARRGTAAASMGDQVPRAIRNERNKVLRTLSHAQKRAFERSFVGAELDAVIESSRQELPCKAVTDNYIRLPVTGVGVEAVRSRTKVRIAADARSAVAVVGRGA